MDFSLDENQRAISEMALRFAREEMAPHAARWDEEKHFPKQALRSAAALGFSGLCVAEESGGAGMKRLDSVLVFESLARGCITTAAYLSNHNMVTAMIDRHGDMAQKQKWLAPLLSMDMFSSYCLSEPSCGSDAAALQTKATRTADGYRLDGAKAFISGAGESDLAVVMARTGGPGAGGISAFLVDSSKQGIVIGAQERKLGWNAQPTATITFENCCIGADALLGKEGQGFRYAMQALDGGRLNIAACSLGGARLALDLAKNYVCERRAFGKKLADFQHTQFTLAEMETVFEAARLILCRAAFAYDTSDKRTSTLCAMAKRFVTEECYKIVDRALQLFGGYGYLRDYPLERLLRDLRVHRILEGTSEIMNVIIARGLLAEVKR